MTQMQQCTDILGTIKLLEVNYQSQRHSKRHRDCKAIVPIFNHSCSIVNPLRSNKLLQNVVYFAVHFKLSQMLYKRLFKAKMMLYFVVHNARNLLGANYIASVFSPFLHQLGNIVLVNSRTAYFSSLSIAFQKNILLYCLGTCLRIPIFGVGTV